MPENKKENMEQAIHDFLTSPFSLNFERPAEEFETHGVWSRFRDLGTHLWLDTGSLPDIEKLWTREFSALTTNNTLLNREVQTGQYDELIRQADELLEQFSLSPREKLLEIAFILNAHHGLRLVDRFNAFVSVEEHTDLANDLDRAVSYARRFHAVCPERFIVKIPFTPAGVLATRKVRREGIAVNHTLGFGARQNYLVTRIARPSYVNVFLGRLNSFVKDNNLGSGEYIGEKAALASQSAVTQIRQEYNIETQQIAASLRNGQQVIDLAGMDVFTMPPKAAEQALSLIKDPQTVTDKTETVYTPGVNSEPDPHRFRLETLWEIDKPLVYAVDRLEKENLDSFSADDLVDFLHQQNVTDLFVRWSRDQIDTSREEGKIPKLENWKEPLASGRIGLDSLMNLAGLNSFITDQTAMDDRVSGVLEKIKTT